MAPGKSKEVNLGGAPAKARLEQKNNRLNMTEIKKFTRESILVFITSPSKFE
jgi:hypothetical protein